MKKILSALLVAVTMIGASFSCVMAEEAIPVYIEGRQIEFDVAPQIVNGRTMVPMRKIFETLGAEVIWNGETRRITGLKGNTRIVMYVDNPIMTVNDVNVTLDAPPKVINDRTLVPVRAIAESFGVSVFWRDEIRTVSIYTDKKTAKTTKMFDNYGNVIDAEQELLNLYSNKGWKKRGTFFANTMEIKERATTLQREYNDYLRFDISVRENSSAGNESAAKTAFTSRQDSLSKVIKAGNEILYLTSNKTITDVVNQVITRASEMHDMSFEKFLVSQAARTKMNFEPMTNEITRLTDIANAYKSED